MRYSFLLIITLAIAAVFGCSSNGNIPVIPVESAQHNAESTNNHMLWGLYQFTADPVGQTLDVTPLRMADLHLNALPFLEPPAKLYLTLEAIEFNGNIIDADIGLRHPFLGLTKYTGFDVAGILITNGSITGFDNPDIRIAGAGDTRLLNPDGAARWWNPTEFPDDGTIFGYTDGMLGAPDSFADYNCTVNGYKYFCDELTDPDAPLSDVNPLGRGVFSAGQKNVRHYKIELGTDGLVFNYAIDASWKFPSGSSPYTAPDDFPEEANRPEAWWIDVEITGNTLWNDGVSSGGGLSMQIDVYDWYNVEMNLVSVESPGNFTGEFDLVPTGGGEGYSTYEIEITSATPAFGEIAVLIAAESENEDYAGFIPGENTTAYQLVLLEVVEDPGAVLEAIATAEIEPYFDGFGPEGTTDDPVPTEWYLTLDATASTGAITQYLWEMNGDDLFDDASGMVVSAGFPDTGTHVIKLKVVAGPGVEDIFELPGSYEVVTGTYVWDAFSGTSDGSRDNPWTDIPDALTDVGTDGYILVRGDDGAGGQCVYDDDLLLNAVNDGTQIQGYYGDYDTDEPPNQTGWLKVENAEITFDGFEVTGPSLNGTYTYSHSCKIGAQYESDVIFRHLYIHDLNQTAGGCPKAVGAYDGAQVWVENMLQFQINASHICNQAGYHDSQMDFVNCTLDQLQTAHTHGGGYYDNGIATFNVNSCIWTDIGPGGFCYIWNADSVIYNCACDTPTPPDGSGNYYSGVIPGPGCITLDPDYIDPFSDHHLDTGSPCIDTGDPAITDYDDFLSDMGCYGGPYGDWDFEN